MTRVFLKFRPVPGGQEVELTRLLMEMRVTSLALALVVREIILAECYRYICIRQVPVHKVAIRLL